ncbi:hypothetical protein BC936DRAFT_140890 [Jimgerdemannia flammicorona]|uniref:Phox homologous domain-containing protein n=1 Tax=Jimgerdemannia flammicorona TaxID=994334 RepID=A0A433A396_9FUNG|nr:hypothetical protein BC936DRAFT_140890 [Jimgerdemannia flammicorona]
MSEVIQALFIRTTETRQDPKPHTVYCVQVQGPVRTWSLWKRYSEFDHLHTQFLRLFPKNPPPLNLPQKSIFQSTLNNPPLIEDRRRGLEAYLRGILSSRDDRWRESNVWKEFLSIPTGRPLDTASMYTSESWLDEFREMQTSAREIRSHLNRRETHLARNEISASHNCTMQAKKLLVSLQSRIANLESGLQGLAKGAGASIGSPMSEGELRRRQDMLSELKDEKETLMKLANTGRQETLLYDRRALLNDSETSASSSGDYGFPIFSSSSSLLSNNGTLNGRSPPKPAATSRRVFGNVNLSAAPKETEVTRGLDNGGLITLQQQMMEDQDQQIEQFSSILARQKHVGMAIEQELETQIQLLDELVPSVDRTQGKLKFTQKRLNKIK